MSQRPPAPPTQITYACPACGRRTTLPDSAPAPWCGSCGEPMTALLTAALVPRPRRACCGG